MKNRFASERLSQAVNTAREKGRTVEIEIGGLDVKQGIMMTGGKLEYYIDALTVFHEDSLEKIDKIRKALEDGDNRLYAVFIHGFKSTCACIGAAALSEKAKELEAAAESADMPFIEANNEEFIGGLNALLDSIGRKLECGFMSEGENGRSEKEERE